MKRNVALLATAGIFLALFITAALLYEGFFSSRVIVSLLADNAFLGIAAIGMTLVIFSGGIDLSVGAVIGFTSIFTATLIASRGLSPVLVWPVAIVAGAVLGAGMGALVHVFKMPAFLVTLAGMFFARGADFAPVRLQIGAMNGLAVVSSGTETGDAFDQKINAQPFFVTEDT